MKKIILCLILIGFLRAFIDMPPGWRHESQIENTVSQYWTWADCKGDTIVVVGRKVTSPKPLLFEYSFNDGFSWEGPITVTTDSIVDNFRVCIDKNGNIYVVYEKADQYRTLKVLYSSNMGITWTSIYSFNDSLWNTFSRSPWIASRDSNVYLVFAYKKKINNIIHGVLKLIHFKNGQLIGQEDVFDSIYCELYNSRITIGIDGTIYIVYRVNCAIGSYWKLSRKMNNQWASFPFPKDTLLVYEYIPNKMIVPDKNNPNILHSIITAFKGSSYHFSYWKSQNYGATWDSICTIEPSGVSYSDFEVDKQKILVAYTPSGTESVFKLIESYDNGSTWDTLNISISTNPSNTLRILSNKRSRLIIWPSSALQYGVRLISNDKELISPYSGATALNSQKHLLREPNTQKLHVIYTMRSDSNDIVWAKSTDGGTTWQPYKIIGHGLYPSSWLNPSGLISVAWFKVDTPNVYGKYREYNYTTGEWSNLIGLKWPSGYIVEEDKAVSPPVFSIVTTGKRTDNNLTLHLVSPSKTSQGIRKLLYTSYDINILNNPESTICYSVIDESGGENPSLAFSNVGVLKLHCVYEKDNKIYYSEKTQTGSWTSPLLISHSDKPAYNPSIEVYGDSLYVVWSEDEGTGKHEVFRRRKKVTEPYNYWPSDPEPVSENSQNYDSRYPTNSELKYTLWQEEDHSYYDYDPWFRYDYNSQYVINPFKNTLKQSYFPHSNRYLSGAIYLFGIWTEEDNLLYRILSHRILLSAPPDGESSYLSYSGGENSPYLIEREGIKDYGNIRVDIGQNLIYEFHLDTIYSYEVEAEFYFEGNGIRKGKIITSNFDLPFEYKGNEIKKIRFEVKKENLFE
ncbi:MAG: hypothetical protein ABIN23_08580, partial [candidate division WOR-3 bacterium]